MDKIVQEKSFEFAVRIVNLCKYLRKEYSIKILTDQIFRCGTSIGANVAEAQQAQSRADFISKLSIALKEASETIFWLRLLHRTNYISQKAFQSMFNDCIEILKLLTSIIKSTKE